MSTKYIVLEKTILNYFSIEPSNDLLDYSTDRSITNLINQNVWSLIEDDFTVKIVHADSSDKNVAYILKTVLVANKTPLTMKNVKLTNHKKFYLAAGNSYEEYQLLKVDGKRHIYMLINDYNYPNVYFMMKDGRKEVAPWQK